MNLELIQNKINDCTLCGNLPKPKCNSFKVGISNILIIGESPAKDGWLKSGKAFYDINSNLQATGKILSKLLKLIDLSIEDISFTECCKCHISDRNKLYNCSNNCKTFLMEQIKNCNQDIILTMGLFPTQILLNTKINKFKDYVGKSFYLYGKTIIPIYHCSPINPLSYKGNENIFISLKESVKLQK